ncbi:hypothetical protein [Thalassotalea atypica]|uniref:hypothetical protein n=1 Tax=Thalassotalea atypica TaxID=2054316 RepID=UPI002572F08D|nr:hypothetical protein [Thalassotalea atypica]
MIEKVPLRSNYLSLYVEGSEGLVFNHIQQCLYQIPAVSIALLLALEQGSSREDIVHELSQSTDVPKTNLVQYVDQLEVLLSQQSTKRRYIDGRYPELSKDRLSKTYHLTSNHNTYLIANTFFAIEAKSPRLMAEITELLMPCEVASENVDVCITIEQTDSNFTIVANGIDGQYLLSYKQVMPELIDCLQILAFQHSNYQYCFHGAAIHTNKGCLLLPGTSGAGKSTLTAALTYENNALFSDEMIVFDEKFNLTVLNLPIAVKQGSWQTLSSSYPELEMATQWQRVDGRYLKYVWPNKFAPQNNGPKANPLFLLVNPQWQDNNLGHQDEAQRTENVNPLTVIQTLTVLTQSGYQLGFELNEEKLEMLIQFLTSVKRFHLRYHTSAEAMSKLDVLW